MEDKVHLYTGPKGVRFVPIFGKSADFLKKKLRVERRAAQNPVGRGFFQPAIGIFCCCS
jgi:hypothetical protein